MTHTLLRRQHRLLLVILLICLYSSVVKATTVVMPTDLNMVIGSRSIVRARVRSVGAAFDERTGLVCTYIRLNVREVLKGDVPSKEITLKEPGGEAGDRGSVVFGAPEFAVGEHVLVYLDTWPDGSLRVHEMLLGKFSITRDPRSGQLFVVRNTVGAHVEVLPDSNAAESGAPGANGAGTNGETITSRMELNDYTAMIRKKLAASLEQARAFESRYYAGITMLSEPPEYVRRVRTGGLEPQFHIFNPACRYFEPDGRQPVSFSVNPDGAPNPQILDDIGAAMHTWSSVPGCALQVVNAGTVSTCRGVGGSLIYFNNCDGMFGASSGCAAIIALGGFHTLDSSTTKVVNGTTFDRILRSFVTFNPFASCYFGDHCSVQEITTHEMGHALGLGHSWDPIFPGPPTGIEVAATMYFVAHFDGRCSSLKSDDINAIKFIYPGTNPGLGSPLPLAIGSLSPLPGGYPATPYTQSLVASGGVIPYTWSLMAGTLPDGLVMTSDGFIWGRPGSTGDFRFTAKLVDAASQTLQADFTITIALGSPPTDAARFVSQTIPTAVDPGQSFNVSMVWNNTGIENWSDAAGFSLTTQNPANNTTWGGNHAGLSGAIITPNRQMGMTFTAVAPSQPGMYQFQWQWQKDGVGFFGDLSPNASIVVRQPVPPLFITSGALSNGSLGSPFLQELAATGGVPPYTWSIVSGGLPPGLAIDAASQSIRGTPSAAGTFSFTLLVTDSRSTSSQKQASITIIAQPLSIQTQAIPAAIAGSAYTQQLALIGGVGPYTWSISSGALASGLSLDQVAGTISGTTTQKGSFDFIATVSDHAGSTASKAYQLNVVAPNSVPELGAAKYKASGRKLIVRGQNFDPAAVLFVDENQAAGRVGDSDTITAKPIDLGPGQHTVRVTNPNGASSSTISLTVN